METGGYRQYPELLVVTADPKTQLSRLQLRDNLQEVEAARIIASQMSNADKQAVATEVILNNGDIETLRTRVSQVWAKILSRQDGRAS